MAPLITMPVESETAPPVSVENTRPSAVSWAAVQPRYETAMTALVPSSMVRP